LYINDTSSCTFQKNKFINKVYGNSLIEKHKIIKKKYSENKEFYSIKAAHNGYEKKFGYIHTRDIKIFKNENRVIGEDTLEKTKNCLTPLYYAVRFHIYHNIKIAKTKSGNSILISLSNGEGWLLKSQTNNLNIEKSLFLGNRNKVINNESIFMSGDILNDIISIKWEIEKVS